MGTGNGGPTEVKQEELQELWRSKRPGSIQAVLLSPQGPAALHSNTNVVVLESASGPTIRHELSYAESSPTALDFSSKGTEIIVGYANGFLKWWNTDSGEETISTQFPYSAAANDLASPQLHQHSNGTNLRSISDVKCCRGSGLLAAACNRAVCIFGPGGEHLHTLTTFTQAVEHLLWLRDGVLAAVEGSQVRSWGVSRERPPRVGPEYTAGPAASIRCALVAPNSHYLAAACGNGTAQVWALQRGPPSDKKERITPLAVFQEAFGTQINELAIRRCMAWSASSRFLATAHGSEALIWDAADPASNPPGGSRRESTVCLGHHNDTHLTALAFQPSGSLLATAADNGQLLAFDSGSISKGGLAVGFINAIASAHLRPPTSAASITWTPQPSILVASASGDLVALKPVDVCTPEPAGHASSPSPSPAPARQQQMLRQSRQQQQQQQQQQAANSKPAPPSAGRTNNSKGPPAGWGGEPLLTTIDPPASGSPLPFAPARAPRARPDSQPNGPTGPLPARNSAPPSSRGAPPPAPAKPPLPSQNPTSATSSPSPQPPTPSQGLHASAATPPAAAGRSGNTATAPPASSAPAGAGAAPPAGGASSSSKGTAGRPQRAKQAPSAAEAAAAGYWRDMGAYMASPEGPGSPLPPGGWGMMNPMSPMGIRGWPMQPPMPMMGPYGQMIPGMPPYLTSPTPGAGQGMPPQFGGKGLPPMPAAGFPPPRPGMPGMGSPHQMQAAQMQAMGAGMGGYMYAAPPQQMGQWPMPPYPPQQWGGMQGMQGMPPFYYYYPTMTPSLQGTPRTSSSGLPPDTPTSSAPGTPRPARPPSTSGMSDISALEGGGGEGGEGGRAVVTLYVGNLAANVTEDVLIHHFASFGAIQSVQIIRDRTTSASRGFGFVTFQHPGAAAGAMKHMNGQVLMGPYEGRAIKVSPSNRR